MQKRSEISFSTEKYAKEAKFLEDMYGDKLEHLVINVFSVEQQKRLIALIQMTGEKEPQSFAELERVSKTGNVRSYISCILSSFGQGAVNMVVQQLKEWRNSNEF